VGVPQRFVHSALVVLVAGKNEQGIGEAVEVGQRQRADRLLAGEGDKAALGTPADCAGDVQGAGAG